MGAGGCWPTDPTAADDVSSVTSGSAGAGPSGWEAGWGLGRGLRLASRSCARALGPNGSGGGGFGEAGSGPPLGYWRDGTARRTSARPHPRLLSAADRCKEVQQIREQHPSKIPVSSAAPSHPRPAQAPPRAHASPAPLPGNHRALQG